MLTAPCDTWKWSSIKKGVKLGRSRDPMERRTRAPTPWRSVSSAPQTQQTHLFRLHGEDTLDDGARHGGE